MAPTSQDDNLQGRGSTRAPSCQHSVRSPRIQGPHGQWARATLRETALVSVVWPGSFGQHTVLVVTHFHATLRSASSDCSQRVGTRACCLPAFVGGMSSRCYRKSGLYPPSGSGEATPAGEPERSSAGAWPGPPWPGQPRAGGLRTSKRWSLLA